MSESILIGYTKNRSKNALNDMLGDGEWKGNLFPGPIPVNQVIKKLFNWEAVEVPFSYDHEGHVIEPGFKYLKASDNGDFLGFHSEGYEQHSYKEWLIDNWGHILDQSANELNIASAGTLQNRKQAFVTFEMPETWTTPEGVEFRPYLLGHSSFNGSLSTGYGRKVILPVCVNTFAAARAESGSKFSLRHTKHSHMRIAEAREALQIVSNIGEEFAKEIALLTSAKVSDKQWESFLNAAIPVPEMPEGKEKHRGVTVAEKKREEINALYKNSEMAAPWNGTAFGVIQAVNTYNHHLTQVRKGEARIVRNMENVLSGKLEKNDADVIKMLNQVGVKVPA